MLESDRILQHPIENPTAEVHVGSDCGFRSDVRWIPTLGDPLVGPRVGFRSDPIRSDRFRCLIHAPEKLSFDCTIINTSGISFYAKNTSGSFQPRPVSFSLVVDSDCRIRDIPLTGLGSGSD